MAQVFWLQKNERRELPFTVMGKTEGAGSLIWFQISVSISYFITEDFLIFFGSIMQHVGS